MGSTRVGDCAGLPWSEVVQTICEHLAWVTPTGRNKFASCAKALAQLERAGLLTLPVKQVGLGGRQRVVIGPETDAEAAVTGTVRDIAPILTNHHRALRCILGSFPLEVPSAPVPTPRPGAYVSTEPSPS